MKAKITKSKHEALDGINDEAQRGFMRRMFLEVVHEHLGVEVPLVRPAAYFAQVADEMLVLEKGAFAVVFQLTGITVPGREPKQFHKGYERTCCLLKELVETKVAKGVRVHISVQFCLSERIPVEKDKGVYSSLIDYYEEWVEGQVEAVAA